ncbi:MAG: amidase, partial [Alphaproteobacteria bacterium]|nr:amidase [Alphaproteobacteria bacterium]
MTATEQVAAYRRRALSPVDVVKAAFARIDKHDKSVNALCLRDEAGALALARASEARWARGEPLGALDGVPMTVKDLVHAAGWPTRRGSFATEADPVPSQDPPAVRRMRQAGAIPIGKTTTPEFGWKGLNDCPLTGHTRNPWNTKMTPGGSSGGAAVAAALGMGTLHIGTDGAGSVRIPAAFTGVFGLKPTLGRAPIWPPSLLGTLSHLGPMTRTVTDGALMLTVIAGPDPMDWRSLTEPAQDYRIGLEEGVRGLKVAYAPTFGTFAVHPGVAKQVKAAAQVLSDLGADVEEACPDLSGAPDIETVIWECGMALSIKRFDQAQRARMDPGFVRTAERGLARSALELAAAEHARAEMATRLWDFHRTYDLLLTPQMPIPAFPVGQDVADPKTQANWWDWSPFTYPFNLSHQPAASMPCGFAEG